MRRTTASRVLALLLALGATSACQLSQLQFENDERLTFSAPAARHKVTVPVTVSWSMKGFEPVGLDGSRDAHKGVYAVFVDAAPMPVGKDLKWVARNDPGCKRDAQCPNAQFLADRGIFVTTSTKVTLDALPPAPDGIGLEQHYVNVVLLDGTGHRIGESAWYRPFTSKRRSTA